MDAYVTHLYYQQTYGGTQTSVGFDLLNRKAQSTVDYYTRRRIKDLEEVPEEAKLAICELIDYEAEIKDQSGVKAESIGSFSTTYKDKSDEDIAKDKKEIIFRNLAHTGLLYRGVV